MTVDPPKADFHLPSRAQYGPNVHPPGAYMGCEWPRGRPRHHLRLAAVDGHLIAAPGE